MLYDFNTKPSALHNKKAGDLQNRTNQDKKVTCLAQAKNEKNMKEAKKRVYKAAKNLDW